MRATVDDLKPGAVIERIVRHDDSYDYDYDYDYYGGATAYLRDIPRGPSESRETWIVLSRPYMRPDSFDQTHGYKVVRVAAARESYFAGWKGQPRTYIMEYFVDDLIKYPTEANLLEEGRNL